MNPRVAIVTGGSRGIGRAISERFTADGYQVAIAYAGNTAAADETVAAITAAGGEAFAIQADISDETQVVINSAGIMSLAPVADFDLAEFDRIVATNLRGAFIVSQLAARTVREGGSIINFSTTVTRTHFPNYAPYAATKAAVEAIAPILAKELAGKNITVNTVAPGPTATDLFLDGKDEATIARLAGMNPMNRLGTPDDIAEVVAFLAGPARWVNGQTIFANGGVI
jgi:3-oxoacyl-[acyl-carrier protein] reductase